MARPAKYTDPEEILKKWKEYKKYCEKGENFRYVNKRGQEIDANHQLTPSIEGLCRFLGFNHEHALDDYGKKKKFSSVVSRVKLEMKEIVIRNCENGIIEPQIARMRMAKLGYSERHSVDVNFKGDVKGRLSSAIAKSTKAKKIKDK